MTRPSRWDYGGRLAGLAGRLNSLHGLGVVVEGRCTALTDDADLHIVADGYEGKYGERFISPAGTRFGPGDSIRDSDRNRLMVFHVVPARAFGFSKAHSANRVQRALRQFRRIGPSVPFERCRWPCVAAVRTGTKPTNVVGGLQDTRQGGCMPAHAQVCCCSVLTRGGLMSAGHANPDLPREVSDTDLDERKRIADERDSRADKREAALDQREIRSAAREAGSESRAVETQKVLADAASRDDLADARDLAADDREQAASLDLFVHPITEHDAAIRARRLSAMDRLDSKTDRSSSAEDRSRLSESDQPDRLTDDSNG